MNKKQDKNISYNANSIAIDDSAIGSLEQITHNFVVGNVLLLIWLSIYMICEPKSIVMYDSPKLHSIRLAKSLSKTLDLTVLHIAYEQTLLVTRNKLNLCISQHTVIFELWRGFLLWPRFKLPQKIRKISNKTHSAKLIQISVSEYAF